jgi:hypothetical protein
MLLYSGQMFVYMLTELKSAHILLSFSYVMFI